MKRKLAVIAGGTGAIGRGLSEALTGEDDWDVVVLARRPVDLPGARSISVDLTNRAECEDKLAGLAEATHIFYTARIEHAAGRAEPIEANLAMLRNVVETIEPRAPALKHVHLVHGTKWYASHLGPFPTPAREDDPRSLATNFYYPQQDYIAARQSGKEWTWTASRPHGICHRVPDNPRNLVLVIAVYALVCREMGLPLSFPGTPENYRAIYQCTSADHLAQAIRWMANEPRCANQAFNVTNGDYIRWERLWPVFARYFGLELGPVRTVKLAEVMADKSDVWSAIARRHGLRAPEYERLALWSYGDFVFTPGWDMMSDMTRARICGFPYARSTEAEFIAHFEHFRAVGVLP